jgi:hypothetical protein
VSLGFIKHLIRTSIILVTIGIVGCYVHTLPHDWKRVIVDSKTRYVTFVAMREFLSSEKLTLPQRLLYRYSIVISHTQKTTVVMFLPREEYSRREDDDSKSQAIEVHVVFDTATARLLGWRAAPD